MSFHNSLQPLLAYIAVRDLQFKALDAMRVYSHSYRLVTFLQPIAAECWRGRGGKHSKILRKKTQYLINILFHRLSGKTKKDSTVQFVGCSLNIVLFPMILKYSGLWPFSVFPRCQCVYTHQAGRKPGLQQNWQSSEKYQSFKEKTQYLMNTLYLRY